MPAKSPFVIRKATTEDAAEAAVIYNEGIDERMATFVTTHVSAEEMCHKIVDLKDKYPFFVAITEDEDRRVAGWGSISPYSPRACYDGIGEISIYIRKGFRRRGIGEALAKTIYQEATRLGYWKLMARIFAFNKASIALFKKLGYVEAGFHRNHGRLDGKWLDVIEVERSIPRNLI